jgi:thiol-disulfide isomerase/thioredoxin
MQSNSQSGKWSQDVTELSDALVDFWATWCGPCISMAPEFARAAAELKGSVVFAKIGCDVC